MGRGCQNRGGQNRGGQDAGKEKDKKGKNGHAIGKAIAEAVEHGVNKEKIEDAMKVKTGLVQDANKTLKNAVDSSKNMKNSVIEAALKHGAIDDELFEKAIQKATRDGVIGDVAKLRKDQEDAKQQDKNVDAAVAQAQAVAQVQATDDQPVEQTAQTASGGGKRERDEDDEDAQPEGPEPKKAATDGSSSAGSSSTAAQSAKRDRAEDTEEHENKRQAGSAAGATEGTPSAAAPAASPVAAPAGESVAAQPAAPPRAVPTAAPAAGASNEDSLLVVELDHPEEADPGATPAAADDAPLLEPAGQQE